MVDKTPAELDPGTASDTSVVHASENDVITNSRKHAERDISRLQGTSPLYSSSKTYIVNDLVNESEIVYRCISSIAVPEPFNLANWTEINAEDVLIFVRNITGSMIPKGSAVYVTGEDSGIPTVDLALASGTSTVPSIGVAQENISNNNNGEVVYIGNEIDLDTSSFTAGDILYLSATSAGDLTTTPPTHPNLRQRMAIVLVSDVSVGILEVLTGDVSGAESGTIFNTFAIGDSLAGTKTLSFVNAAGTFTVDSTPTTSRTQSFQDANGTLALTSDVIDTTASNVGTGVDVFLQKLGIDLEFRTLLANTEVLIAQNAQDLAFSIGAIAQSKITGLVTDLGTKIDTIVNVGTGTGLVFRDIVGTTANLKTLLSGTGISVTNNADDITISLISGVTKSGSDTVALGGTTTVSFNTAFPTAPNVVVSFATDVNYTTAEKGVALSVYNITVNGFTVRYDEPDGSGVDPASFEWIATNAGNP